MQHTLYLEIVSCLAEDGFSLDELVLRTKELFEQEGMPGFVGLLLMLFDEQLARGLVGGRAVPGVPLCGCGHRCWEVCAVEPRRIRTSIGTVQFQWRRLRCTACGKSVIPLREVLQLQRYQSKTAELERIVAEIVSEQSYRRTSAHLHTAAMVRVPPMTAQRWVMQSACDAIDTDGKRVEVLMADGTGYKRTPRGGQSNRGEVRIVIGVDGDGQVAPFGAWTRESWESIGQAIGQHPAQEELPEPIARLLLTDGESGLPEALGRLAEDRSRCHWHQTHDLNAIMSPGSGAFTLRQRRQFQKKLAGIIEIELPPEDFEQVAWDDKVEIAARM